MNVSQCYNYKLSNRNNLYGFPIDDTFLFGFHCKIPILGLVLNFMPEIRVQ